MLALFPSSRFACALLACLPWLGCALDLADKSACRTDLDCNPGRVCSMRQCVTREAVVGEAGLDAGETGPESDAHADDPDDAGDEGPLEESEESGAQPDACALDEASSACSASAGSCEEPDFDRVDGTCTKRDDCAGVSSCAPGECVDGVRTYACGCPSGFMAQGKACLPAAGCAALACSQRCVSGLAKPTCACDGELVLASDDRSCKTGAWSEPVVLSETGSSQGAVALAVSRTGPAMVIFQQLVSDVLELSARPFRHNAWEAATRLEREAHDGNIDVAIDDFGRSTVMFEQVDPTGRHQFGARYANNTWNLWRLLDGSVVSGLEEPVASDGLEGVKIAASGPGHFYAIWRHARVNDQGSTTHALYVNELAPEKSDSVAHTLSPDAPYDWGNDIDVSVEEGGVAAAVWTTPANGTQAALAMIDSFQDRAWMGPKPVALDGAGARALRASVAASGRTTHIVWVSDGGVYHRELAADGTPTEPVAALTGQPGFVTSAAAGPNLTAIWTESVDGIMNLRASTKRGDGAWSAPSTLDSAGLIVPRRVRVVSDGAAVVLYVKLQERGFSLELSRYSPATESWSAPMRCNAEGSNIATGDVGMDEGHRIMLAWSELTPGGGSRIFARRFE